MIDLHLHYIVDDKLNKQSVIIPYDEWKEIVEAMEELEDIQAYDKAKALNDEVIPFEMAVSEINGGHSK